MVSENEGNFPYKAKMKEIIPKIEILPTPPIVVTKIMEMSEDSKSSAEDIAKVIALDQALTMKMLKLSNSAYYGFRQKVSSLDSAVVTLGLKVVRNLALSIAMLEAFPASGAEGDFDRRMFWEHSVGCAVISKLLAKRTGYPRDKMEEAFTAGLLHDIGKVVLDRYLHEEYGSVVRMAKEENIPIIEAEEKVLGVTHAEVGHLLSFMWKLPKELQWVIYSHHNPEGASGNSKRLAGIVYFGDIVCREKEIGSGGDNVVPPIDEKVFKLAELDSSDLEAIMDLIDEEVNKAGEFLPNGSDASGSQKASSSTRGEVQSDGISSKPSQVLKLGEILLRDKFITEEQLEKALEYQKQHPTMLGQVLIDLGLVTKKGISEALRKMR